MCLYYTGLRLDEVRNLKWQDIDVDRSIIHVKMTKGERERVVFLHSKLKEMLEIYSANKQGLVFISQRGGKYNKRTIQQIVKNAARKAGIEKKLTPHTPRRFLRHTYLKLKQT